MGRLSADYEAQGERLFWLAVSPAIWMAHLLVTYATVAIWCAKVVDRAGSLGGARALIVAYTVLALAGVAATGRRGFRRRREFGTAAAPHDFDSPEGRQRFLGFAVLLLSGLSAVGILYVALPALFFGSCR
ncbi:MAG: hypothetical protein M5U28_31100 [Sandaracinaceae bacterium]|nr:hypothetical protein [Sandaracinaceae bacterium]